MSPSGALLAVRTEGPSVLGTMAAAMVIEALVRCILPPVPNAASRLKSPFSLAATSRYTAGTATPDPDKTQ